MPQRSAEHSRAASALRAEHSGPSARRSPFDAEPARWSLGADPNLSRSDHRPDDQAGGLKNGLARPAYHSPGAVTRRVILFFWPIRASSANPISISLCAMAWSSAICATRAGNVF